MASTRANAAPRLAVVDLGSNSVRLVVYEGCGRNPVAIFNEKAVLRLGRGLLGTGRLNQEGTTQAFPVLARYHAVARAMRADCLEVLATAAVRDATNGPDFVRALQQQLPGLVVRVLSGDEEAELSALGVLCGIPEADGILAGIGGGSLELGRLTPDGLRASDTLLLGVIRLAERSGGDPERARDVADADLSKVSWLAEGEGRDLYLVGGAWRALARVHMAQVGYPLQMVHHYTIGREEARNLAAMIGSVGKRVLDRVPGLSRKRIEDLPFAAMVLRRLLRAANSQRVVFSAAGLREGWYMLRIPEEIRREDPLLSAGRHYADWLARDPTLPPPLVAWTAPLFPNETKEQRRLREAACWMSDIGSLDHPEFRAEQAFLRVLRQPGLGLDHQTRAFLALAIALRYESEPDADYLRPARLLLDPAAIHRAEVLGLSLRLAYTLCGGTPEVLAATALSLDEKQLVLRLDPAHGVFAGESLIRRLDRVAQALDLIPAIRSAGS